MASTVASYTSSFSRGFDTQSSNRAWTGSNGKRSVSAASLEKTLTTNGATKAKPPAETPAPQQPRTKLGASYLLRQYTYDALPSSPIDFPSARSRSLHSETTRPHSSSQTSEEDEEAPPSPSYATRPPVPQRPGRKLSLTFLGGCNLAGADGRRSLPPSPLHVNTPPALAVGPPSELATTRLLTRAASLSHRDLTIPSTKSLFPKSSSLCETHTLVMCSPPLSVSAAIKLTPENKTVDTTPICQVEILSTPTGDSSQCSAAEGEDCQINALVTKDIKKKTKLNLTQKQAAVIISRAWKQWLEQQQFQIVMLVEAIRQAREQSAAIIQRVWKGHRLRRFVHSEVCQLRVLYWEPSMDDFTGGELSGWSVKIYGNFTVPAWKSEVSMEFCRLRRKFVLNTTIPVGCYECKFIVNGRHTACPSLYESTPGVHGTENSRVIVAEHPQRSWWTQRLSYFDRPKISKRRTCFDKKNRYL
eukprot:Blabericola_migrator_1__3090@NODE_18_length_22925_cov_118_464826_g15_i0_p5_GENE_NODE_18_length_22925_cov_118_464826_g15_i0NODE_18_length_22925_cov_118_464826_g15_i0_p5_ORF_typecomplete_len473_score37_75AMPK1_CBM/PF16561_5/2_9e03AMPK1_CBM/PF16561_5/1_1e06IQ/PF00612_27/24IQ/PF00612_27/0_044COMMD1_N/PF17221_3/4_1COMMD1_N/PF17221_3/73IQCJSCHIP1/PF15157_6/2_4IQCJSCHIP1/PF15157_6/3_7e02_NODE_18_length_22925_cov_118_464826_g15_i01347114889